MAAAAPMPHSNGKEKEKDEPVVRWVDAHLPSAKAGALNGGHPAGPAWRPYVTLTYAQSLDGCIAHEGTDRLILSGDESMKMTHKLRARHDGILVGIGTVVADNPSLTTRLVDGPSSLPIVLDTQLRTPRSSKLVARAAASPAGSAGLVIVTTPKSGQGKSARRQALLALPGIRILEVAASTRDSVSLPDALLSLRREFGVRSVMVEGGAKVIGSFLAAASELVDCMVVTVAPCLVGGLPLAVAFGEEQRFTGSGSLPALEDMGSCRLGDDIIFYGQPRPWQEVRVHAVSKRRRLEARWAIPESAASGDCQQDVQAPEFLLDLQSKTGEWHVATRVVEVMVAHSFSGEQFGPAQALHGITFHLSAVFTGRSFAPPAGTHGASASGLPCLLDRELADGLLREVAGKYANTNLDTVSDFEGRNSTCECFAEVVWRRLSEALPAHPHAVESLKVVVQEGDGAFVEYERPLPTATGESQLQATWHVSVRDRMHVAYPMAAPEGSLSGCAVQGSTLVVDAAFSGHELQEPATYLFDIIAAHDTLRDAVSALDQHNLAEVPSFEPDVPVQRWVARRVWQLVAQALATAEGASLVKALRISVAEAGGGARGSYAAPLAACERSEHADDAAGASVDGDAAEGALNVGAQIAVVRRLAEHGLRISPKLCGNTLLLDARVAWRGADISACRGVSAESVRRSLALAAESYSNANLDDMPELGAAGTVSMEVVAAAIWWRMLRTLPAAALGGAKVRVTVQDSDQGSVAFEDAVSPSCSSERAPVLLVDLDGCLMTCSSVLEQHPLRIAEYCRKRYSLGRPECDELHHAHGSTIDGLQHQRASKGEVMPAAEVAEYYKGIFQGIDISPLEAEQRRQSSWESASGMHHRARLRQMLASLPWHKCVATNSPYEGYAQRVLAAMGLSSQWLGTLAPDRDLHGPRDLRSAWPSKDSPAFWQEVRRRFPRRSHELILLDDSERNLRRAAELAGIRGVHVSGERPVEHAMLEALGCVESASPQSAIEYLNAKRDVDHRAFNADVITSLGAALRRRRPAAAHCLRVLDVGAGLSPLIGIVVRLAAGAGYDRVCYVALERSPETVAESRQRLVLRGLESSGVAGDPATSVLSGRLQDEPAAELCVKYLQQDLRDLPRQAVASLWADADGDQLMIACAFVDLLPPDELSAICRRVAPGALCWMPITFAGRTWFEPPLVAASGPRAAREASRIPSDEVVASAYHRHLVENEGQHLDITKLANALTASGALELARGSSDWSIDPDRDAAMWTAMLRFLGLGAPAFLWPHWCFVSWVRRFREKRPVIRAANIDLLFELSNVASPWQYPSYSALSFVAPRKVEVQCRPRREEVLAAGSVELRSLCSLISSGTEMKFYRGDFGDDETEALDSNISGLGGSIAYPMDYGYSLCGRIEATGADVDPRWLGKLVFVFHPHSSTAVVSEGAVHEVPGGIPPSDAVYLPAVETALSIVHDAHPRSGERLLVVGQGLIGLLVTAVLSRMWVEVEVCDTCAERLALSRRFGASATWLASERRPSARFDTTIEVSGNQRGLQTAIDQTRAGGRVIIASWYSSSVDLNLGTRFHRSHIHLIASQVSDIPAQVSATWTKERRFHAAWRLLRELRPSQHLTSMRVPLERAQEAYEALDGAPQSVVAAEIVYESIRDSEYCF